MYSWIEAQLVAQLPFLAITERINQTVLDFNGINIIMKLVRDSEVTVDLFGSIDNQP